VPLCDDDDDDDDGGGGGRVMGEWYEWGRVPRRMGTGLHTATLAHILIFCSYSTHTYSAHTHAHQPPPLPFTRVYVFEGRDDAPY
jgi:hypothetical protein